MRAHRRSKSASGSSVSIGPSRCFASASPTSIDSGIRVSDAEGRYVFDPVHGTELRFWVRGDDVEIGRAHV